MSSSAPATRPAIAVVVLAGGSGLRVGRDRNKAYLPLGGRTAVGISLRTMAAATTPGLRRFVLVVRSDDLDLARTDARRGAPAPAGARRARRRGASRHASEERALRHLEPAIRDGELDLVLIHDAARPMCSPELVATLVRTAAAARRRGAGPAWRTTWPRSATDGTLVPLVGRHVRIQTPQVFAAAPLLEAYHQAAEAGFEGTDTAACLERFSSLTVAYVAGEEQNFKITYPHDVLIADELLRRRRRHTGRLR